LKTVRALSLLAALLLAPWGAVLAHAHAASETDRIASDGPERNPALITQTGTRARPSGLRQASLALPGAAPPALTPPRFTRLVLSSSISGLPSAAASPRRARAPPSL
jgi:hypothetical protein